MTGFIKGIIMLLPGILLAGCGSIEWFPDTNPVVISTASLSPGTVGTPYTSTAMAATGGAGPYTWSWSGVPQNVNVTMNSSGVFGGVPTTTGTFSVSITAKDSSTSNPRSATKTYTITIVPLSILTTSPMPSAVVLQNYSTTFVASGGVQPYTNWSASRTATCPPPGLTFNKTTGKFSGQPSTAINDCTFDIFVWDSTNSRTSKNFSLTILSSPDITPKSLANGTNGAQYPNTPLNATGGASSYTWSVGSGSFPQGMGIGTSNGVINGTPTETGTFIFTITATGINGIAGAQNYTLTIN